MKKIALHWQIFIGLVLGVLFGVFLKEYVSYVSWMGDIFLKALKMVIVPLILSSIISGVANIESGENLGRLGFKTAAYYVSTSLLAIVTGLLLVNIIKPGVGVDLGLNTLAENTFDRSWSFSDTLMNIIPENVFLAMTENQRMLSIIFFAILVGYFIRKTSSNHTKTLRNFFNAFFEVMMKITMFIIRFTPFGVFGIVAKVVAEQNNLWELFSSMGMYMITVLGALSIHFAFTLPLIQRNIGKLNPFKMFKALSGPLLTAFSTSSSSATLPYTMEAVEKNIGVSNKVTSFTLPLGATVNMDGTALYECVATMFIAQAYGIDLSFSQQVLVVVTALLASIGAAGIPMAGMVMITIILSAVGLPLEGIGLILAVDRILDMFRTATNVWSDSTGASIIAASEGESLNVRQKKP